MSSSYTAWDRALSFIANSKEDLGRIISHKASIYEWEKVFSDLIEEKGVKALFIPESEL